MQNGRTMRRRQALHHRLSGDGQPLNHPPIEASVAGGLEDPLEALLRQAAGLEGCRTFPELASQDERVAHRSSCHNHPFTQIPPTQNARSKQKQLHMRVTAASVVKSTANLPCIAARTALGTWKLRMLVSASLQSATRALCLAVGGGEGRQQGRVGYDRLVASWQQWRHTSEQLWRCALALLQRAPDAKATKRGCSTWWPSQPEASRAMGLMRGPAHSKQIETTQSD